MAVEPQAKLRSWDGSTDECGERISRLETPRYRQLKAPHTLQKNDDASFDHEQQIAEITSPSIVSKGYRVWIPSTLLQSVVLLNFFFYDHNDYLLKTLVV
jgi:hypothetical protein